MDNFRNKCPYPLWCLFEGYKEILCLLLQFLIPPFPYLSIPPGGFQITPQISNGAVRSDALLGKLFQIRSILLGQLHLTHQCLTAHVVDFRKGCCYTLLNVNFLLNPLEDLPLLLNLAFQRRQALPFTLHKLRETVKTLQAKENPARYRSQLTLAERRIAAFTIASRLIDKALADEL